MKLLYLIFILITLTSCMSNNNTYQPPSDEEFINYQYYNDILVIDTDFFYEMKDNNDFIIYMYNEKIYNFEVIESIKRYANLLEIDLYAMKINTIYTNNLLDSGVYDDNYYFTNNFNTGKTSISNINRYGLEAIIEFEDGKIKYTFSETNVVNKLIQFEQILLNKLINNYVNELKSVSIEYFLNESINTSKDKVLINDLINRYNLDNQVANLYKDSYIYQETPGIYINDSLNQKELDLIINKNVYKLTQISEFNFQIA